MNKKYSTDECVTGAGRENRFAYFFPVQLDLNFIAQPLRTNNIVTFPWLKFFFLPKNLIQHSGSLKFMLAFKFIKYKFSLDLSL